MNFPRFWARGKIGDFIAWRWSSISLADAQALANQAAQQLADRIKGGERLVSHGGYYPNRPFREQVMQELKNDAGEISAVVTRNSYGCLVLNTARLMFVDIDLPEPRVGFFQKLFGAKPSRSSSANLEAEAIARIEQWTRDRADWGWRIYRTRAGLRLLATHGWVDADSELADGIFEALGADPLYRTLCSTQKCFRARLTPKPWRCGVNNKPARWPFLDARAEKQFEKWEAQYQSFAFNWATCALIKSIGNPAIHPEIQPLLKLHDATTKVESKLQLA